MAFELDTSGYVEGSPEGVRTKRFWWHKLDPFTRDYVEALFATERPGYDDAGVGGHYVCGFSDLAPETLARILEDCARYQRDCGLSGFGGSQLWAARQGGHLPTSYPPLTVSLGNDRRVYLREAS
jgi:hypothetical protein